MPEVLDAQLNYYVAMSVKPAVFNYRRLAEEKLRTPQDESHPVAIRDGSDLIPEPGLDEQGFLLTRHRGKVSK